MSTVKIAMTASHIRNTFRYIEPPSVRCADHPDIVVIAANSDKSEVSMTTMDYQAKSALRLLHRRRRRKLRRRRTRVAASEPTLVNDRAVFVIESWRLRGLCTFLIPRAGAVPTLAGTPDC